MTTHFLASPSGCTPDLIYNKIQSVGRSFIHERPLLLLGLGFAYFVTDKAIRLDARKRNLCGK